MTATTPVTVTASTEMVTDPTYGTRHPANATVAIGPHLFEADEPADWQQIMQLAGLRHGVVAIPPGSPPGPAWMEAANHFARMVRCSCGNEQLDPDSEGFGLGLCAPCHELAGWENAHSDGDHDHHPDPNCPICHTNADPPGPQGPAR